MPKAKVTSKETGPDEIMVEVIDYKPTKQEAEALKAKSSLPQGVLGRDVCGDGDPSEYQLISPVVKWKTFPVLYYIDISVPVPLREGIRKGFAEWTYQAGFEFWKETTDRTQAKEIVYYEVIDTAGSILAVTRWWYNTTGLEITRATTTFDSTDKWAYLEQESCGAVGNIWDVGHVATHEIGHVCGQLHPNAPLQTMHPTVPAGRTLGRTLGAGDIEGFSKVYNTTPPPPPVNKPPVAKDVNATTDKNKKVEIKLDATDPEGSAIQYQILVPPTHGTVDYSTTGNAYVFYTPNTSFVGLDNFTYTASDDKGDVSNPANVTITVKDVIIPPPPPPGPNPIPRLDLPPSIPDAITLLKLILQFLEQLRNR